MRQPNEILTIQHLIIPAETVLLGFRDFFDKFNKL